MYVVPIPCHTCNSYCLNGCHAVPSIGKIGKSHADVRASFTRNANRSGWQVISHKLCEADVVQWAATHGLEVDLSIYDTAYVAIIKEMENSLC